MGSIQRTFNFGTWTDSGEFILAVISCCLMAEEGYRIGTAPNGILIYIYMYIVIYSYSMVGRENHSSYSY